MRALLSVHDKTGLVDFGRELIALGYELIASGGTAKALEAAGLAVTPVERVTGYPELIGGRVKTLHPAIHGGILSRRTAADTDELAAHGIVGIDLVAVTLYPFEAARARGADEAALIEEIDIGGVALLRAAAKSFQHVTVVSSPTQYDEVLASLRAGDPALRRRLAGAALALTSAYDAAIGGWLRGDMVLRYGENPHQEAVFRPGTSAPFYQHSGKELSYNNLLDLDAAWGAAVEFAQPALCIVKHGSPCGLASGRYEDLWADALDSDPVSAFGGVVACNRPVDEALVRAIGDLFIEVLAAPAFSAEALAMLATKKKNCRVLMMRDVAATHTVRTAIGGVLVQSADSGAPDPATWTHVAGPAPDRLLIDTLAFAFHVVKHVKSNAIVLARPNGRGFTTVGIGGGQTNRIDAVNQAIARAGPKVQGAVLASDAFFPFGDGIAAAAAAGVRAVVQPGGALRDQDVIAAADAAGITMMFTGRRHFRH